MLPLLALALFGFLAVLLDNSASQQRVLLAQDAAANEAAALALVAAEIERFIAQNSAPPATLAELANTDGYEHIRGYFDAKQGYSVSPVLSDGVFQYQRAAFFSIDRKTGITDADYLSMNTCGTGSMATADSWCGNGDNWRRFEQRNQYAAEISAQRLRLGRTLQKFSDYYNAFRSFPTTDRSGIDLASNSVTSLAILSGYTGTGANCMGTFEYATVPIGCDDLYDIWGGNVGYQYISPRRIILTAQSPIKTADGTRLIVAAEYDFSKI